MSATAYQMFKEGFLGLSAIFLETAPDSKWFKGYFFNEMEAEYNI